VATARATSPAAAGPSMRADAMRNRTRLIEAARAALTEHGADTSLDEIARRAGVGIGTLYRHFPTRLDLLEAVYREDVDVLEQSAETLIDTRTEWEALEEWLSRFISYAATKRVLFHELVDALGRDSDLLSHSREVINSASKALLTRAQDAGVARKDIEPSDLLRLVGGCTMMPGLEPAQQERMLKIVLDGVRT
jgi:AcrR family transcriptional regulator